MSGLHSSRPKHPAEQAFIVTVGVPSERTQEHCGRALQALDRAGYQAGPTSDQTIETIATQQRLVNGLARDAEPGAEIVGYVVLAELDGEDAAFRFHTEEAAQEWAASRPSVTAVWPVYDPKGG